MKKSTITKIILGTAMAGIITAIMLNKKSQEDDKYWVAEFYDNKDLLGQPFTTILVDSPTTNWHGQPPVEGMPAINWSVRFTKKLYFQKGFHTAFLTSDDGSRFYFDNSLFIDNWHDQVYGTQRSADLITTKDGHHTCTVEYYQGQYGNSRLTFDLNRMEEITIPPGIQNVVEDSDFTMGHWGTHACMRPLNIINIEGTPTLHFDGHEPDDCWIEAWHGSSHFPIMHPGDKIIITNRVRTGPQGPPPTGHPWAGMVMDVRNADNQQELNQIGELTPARIISTEWIEQTWEVTMPIIQKTVWDQKYHMTGIPDKYILLRKGEGRNHEFHDQPMPPNLAISLDVDLGSYNSVEWAEYQDVKAYIIPREEQ